MLNIVLGNILKELDIVKKGKEVDISIPYKLPQYLQLSDDTKNIYMVKIITNYGIIKIAYY
jgi:hypothetical protein